MNTTALSYTDARDRLASIWDQAESTREPVEIRRRDHESMMLVPIGEFAALMETAHLLRSPKNARRLESSLAELRANRGAELPIEELRRLLA